MAVLLPFKALVQLELDRKGENDRRILGLLGLIGDTLSCLGELPRARLGSQDENGLDQFLISLKVRFLVLCRSFDPGMSAHSFDMVSPSSPPPCMFNWFRMNRIK